MRYLLLVMIPFALLTGAQAAPTPKQVRDHNAAASSREAAMKVEIKKHPASTLKAPKKSPAPTTRK